MATYSWNTKIRHDSDANFRLWGAEIGVALTAVGCTQTADTGQINWTTVTRAGANANAGYEIYYINDSLHATAPVYFKVYYGTGTGTSAPRLQIEVGTGSDGSGNITGGNTVGTAGYASNATFNTDTTYASYCCLANGCLTLVTKIGRVTANVAVQSFVIARTCDSNGAADATGILLIRGSASNTNNVTIQTCRFASPSAGWNTATGTPLGMHPYTEATTSDENGYNQMMLVFAQCDRIRPWSTLALYRVAEITPLNTVAGVALVGSTTYTFLALDLAMGLVGIPCGASATSTAIGLFVVYQ